MKRTELTAGIAALINGIFTILAAIGFTWVTPELVGALNGIATPIMIFFLGARMNRVEDKTDMAAEKAGEAATRASITNSTVNKIEAQVAKI